MQERIIQKSSALEAFTLGARGFENLSFSARALFNAILHIELNGTDARYKTSGDVVLSKALPERISRIEIVEAIEAIMCSIIVIHSDSGASERIQILGWTRLEGRDFTEIALKYEVHQSFRDLLNDPASLKQLEAQLLNTFSSKYTMPLFRKIQELASCIPSGSRDYDISELRGILNVESEQLRTTGNLNQYAVKPAVFEVNALSRYRVELSYTKTGRRITGCILSWHYDV